ncbi:class I SAM-dependent methyltransferase [Actinomycetospora flava]|uniref:Class I SAM-dependent methyltransferase n=1 Tax=Actinomycetospora flava TaxID=3129232 RepID=A0ABU8MAI3_9PSEU
MTRTTAPPAGITAPTDTGTVFDAALAGRRHRLVRHDGVVLPLAVQRWHDDADTDDDWLLARCSGPTLDLGCGPGRLVVALADRGVPALGVDVSVQAVERCLERGAAVLHRDAFERLPGEGRWQHVVLADGNIGIGGDPVTLLRRCRALLADGGTILLELEPDAGLWCGGAYLECLDEPALDTLGFDTLADAPWFPWAVLGPHAVDDVAAEAGLRVVDREEGARAFVVLTPA